MTEDVLDALADMVVRPAWHRQAACRGTGPAVFFPSSTHGKRTNVRKEAVEVCASCPVTDECAAQGAREMYGTWAGQSPTVIRKRRRATGAADETAAAAGV